jgi:uncharacterized membrane protein YphA (DoxX/SURF4 family)
LALRAGLGFIWVYEGLVLKLLLPASDLERGVVAASGLVPNGFDAPVLQVLGVMEIILGFMVLLGLQQRLLCFVQGAVVVFFIIAISVKHPETLAHPFGLLVKNVPILGAVAALWFLQGPRSKWKVWTLLVGRGGRRLTARRRTT